jgi:ribosome recycling factor
VGIRNARKDANDFLKEAKNDGMSEDDLKKGEQLVQELTNKYVSQVESVLSAKEADIMTI